MVRGVLAACEEDKEGGGGVLAECEEGEEGVRGGRRALKRDAPIEGGLALLGDGDAVFEKAEGLRAPEGEEVVLDGWFLVDDCVRTVSERGLVERQDLKVGEGGEGGGDDAGERVAV